MTLTAAVADISSTDPSGRPPGGLQDLLVRLPLARDRPLVGVAAAIALTVLATAVRWAADSVLPPGFPFLTFFPAVIVSAYLFGLRAGIVAAIASGLASWLLFIPPYGRVSFDPKVFMALAFFASVAAVDIVLVHMIQLANRRLVAERERGEELARHRELLFSELQHRVGNNIQMSASLLSLQKRKLTDPAARAAIDEAVRRLGMIGRVQRQLYDPTGAQLDLASFLRSLAADVLASCGRDDVTLTVDAQPGLALAPSAAIPTALVIAEVIANAVEHGFADRPGGTIELQVERRDGVLLIHVVDDGRGLPDGAAEAAGKSLGLSICASMARSLGGEFSIRERDRGCRTSLRFPYD